MKNPLLIAHRGDTIHFPENTLEAFKSAFDFKADGIELDVRFFKDQLIVVHNYQFDTSKEYPLLKSVLDNFGMSGRIEIEIKSFSPDVLSPLADLLSQYKDLNYELTTSVLPMVRPISDAFPNTSLGAIFDSSQFQDWMSDEFIENEILDLMELMQADVAHVSKLPIQKLTKSFVDTLHEKKVRVHYHIYKTAMADQIALYAKLANLGVDQCTIDDINLVSEVSKLEQFR